MRLTELVKETAEGMESTQTLDDKEIRGLASDSRKVQEGFVFAALPGTQQDGRDFIPEAVERGAVAILAQDGTSLADDNIKLPLITDPNPRRRLALMAARFYGKQPGTIAAITGTNGKTSVASFTRQIWELAGHKAASLGTLGLYPPQANPPAALTTPDPIDLHRCLAELAEAGFDHLALEASSHGLDQYRLDGLRVTAAAFTNLSRDHLDYHATLADYLAAKTRLFTELLQDGGTAVLNADLIEYDALRSACEARGLKIISYGIANANLRLVSQQATPEGQKLMIDAYGKIHQFDLSLAGDFQAQNALAALALAIAGGILLEDGLRALPSLKAVPGRVERVACSAQGGEVYVDYAHTPDALAKVLKALRPHAAGELRTVFGCGGDRDRGKRPQMGAIAVRLADHSIVTDDNPRSEDPAAIRAEIMAAAPGAQEVGDRGAAIATAVAALGPGDILVIAGKGHESGQIVGGRVLPFDDREVARAAAVKLGGTAVGVEA